MKKLIFRLSIKEICLLLVVIMAVLWFLGIVVSSIGIFKLNKAISEIQTIVTNTQNSHKLAEIAASLKSHHTLINWFFWLNLILFVCSIALAAFLTNYISNILQKEIKRLEEFALRIKSGNLKIEHVVEDNSRNEIIVIGRSFQEAVDTLKNFLKQIKDAIFQISSASEEFSVMSKQVTSHNTQAFSNVKDLLKYVEEFRDRMETIKNSLSQLNEAVNEIAGNAEGTSTDSREADTQVKIAEEVLNSLISEIEKISDSAELIQEIASQTHLLALNATIEASRAGEAGKGFAVVAEEVKELANRSAKTAEEISKRIEALVEKGKEMKQNMQKTLNKISNTKERASSVAAAVEEQSIAIKEVSNIIEESYREVTTLERIAEELRHRTEEAEASNKELIQSAESLNKLANLLVKEVAQYQF